jgi:predicted ATPase
VLQSGRRLLRGNPANLTDGLMEYSDSIHLRTITVKRAGKWPDKFPYNIRILRNLSGLEFSSPVTFLIGENGCGKSTLLEAIACAAGSITVGSESVSTDKSLAAVRVLAKDFKLSWSKKTNRGFFMRSEDFFGFARKQVSLREELQENLEQVEKDYATRSEMARNYARMPYLGELGAMKRTYGGEGDLEAHSHGESYLTLFEARFVPGGLYLLDEPETPLSPLRQLSFLIILRNMLKQNAQFIIATHSPIIMAFPGAVILNLDGEKVEQINYEDIEHVRITKTFLENPERYLKALFED